MPGVVNEFLLSFVFCLGSWFLVLLPFIFCLLSWLLVLGSFAFYLLSFVLALGSWLLALGSWFLALVNHHSSGLVFKAADSDLIKSFTLASIFLKIR